MNYLFKNLSILSVLAFSFCLSSCELVKSADNVISPDNSNAEYVIKEGLHSSSGGINKVKGTSMKYEITFDSSAVYTTEIKENQADINKLFGTSDCGSDHHINSARYGWRWFENELQIFAYTYENEIMANEFITTVEIGKPYEYEIRFEENSYEFFLNDKQVSMPRNCTGEVDGYMLYPYFGGDEYAPHDIKITFIKL